MRRNWHRLHRDAMRSTSVRKSLVLALISITLLTASGGPVGAGGQQIQGEEPATGPSLEAAPAEGALAEPAPGPAAGTWTPTAAPAAVPRSSAPWIEVVAPNSRKLLAVVYRPEGAGPFPVVVVLHGSSGFEPNYLSLAEDLARGGFIVVVGCWFSGSFGRGATADVVPCPDAPEFGGANLDTIGYALALVEAAATQPGVRGERIGIFGHSRGAQAALLIASTVGRVQAVVASAGAGSGGAIDTPPLSLVAGLQAPVLLLHGTADRTVDVQHAQSYEQAARSLGKTVEAHYYEGTDHPLPFLRATRQDVRRGAIAFFQQYLLH